MDKSYFLYLGIFFIVILFVMILRILFWKSVKLSKIAEEETSIGVTDKQMMMSLNKVPGVWAQYVGDKCWNVCKTNNIGGEMSRSASYCSTAIENAIKSDERLRDEYKYQGSLAVKYKKLVKYAVRKRRKIRFVIIMKNIQDDDLLEFYEMKYAVEHKALIWKPAPGKQTKVYYDYIKNGGNIDKYKKMMTS